MCDKNDSPYIHKSTPPPLNRKIRNPFDKILIDKLHKPICSPGMCKAYKMKSPSGFRWEWDIEQHCKVAPADIQACSSQFEPTPDPILEKIAEEATEKFFSQETVMPSPMESSKKIKPILRSSCDASIQSDCFKETITTREFSAQTVLTLPPQLPPELEKLLQPFCTFTQDQDMSGEYEITANGSLRRKLYFDEHSDLEHYDSEQTDDEILVQDPHPPSSFEAHIPIVVSPDLNGNLNEILKIHSSEGTIMRLLADAQPPSSFDALSPVVFSPELSRNFASQGMKRTFGTPPLKKEPSTRKHYRNKILDVVDLGEPCFSPIHFRTPKRTPDSATSSSLASISISPVTKVTSSDDEKNNFTSPESEAMAICLNCVASDDKKEEQGPCFCKITPDKIILKRSASLKDSPPRSRKGSMSEKRSLSMSSLYRSKSVQKLDFTMDMSVDGSLLDHSGADVDLGPGDDKASWSIVEEPTIQELVKTESFTTQLNEIQSSTKLHSVNLNMLDETPIKGKSIRTGISHKICKISAPEPRPLDMSFDNSLTDDNPLSLEDKNIDFNKVDLNFLTENVSQFNYVASDVTKVGDDVSSSMKRTDSGFTENTFYTNASSYYESAIKPSELTVTNTSNKTVLKEISNVNWMRVDSGFKDENSTDSMHFYNNENAAKRLPAYHFSEATLDNKENTEDFDKFLVQTNKNEAMSMSEIFSDDVTFNCNFSSTPSKNKTRKVNS